jgi:hypothetical protein
MIFIEFYRLEELRIKGSKLPPGGAINGKNKPASKRKTNGRYFTARHHIFSDTALSFVVFWFIMSYAYILTFSIYLPNESRIYAVYTHRDPLTRPLKTLMLVFGVTVRAP